MFNPVSAGLATSTLAHYAVGELLATILSVLSFLLIYNIAEAVTPLNSVTFAQHRS
jgi:hypothetical protein